MHHGLRGRNNFTAEARRRGEETQFESAEEVEDAEKEGELRFGSGRIFLTTAEARSRRRKTFTAAARRRGEEHNSRAPRKRRAQRKKANCDSEAAEYFSRPRSRGEEIQFDRA